jgi:hypothetical protein
MTTRRDQGVVSGFVVGIGLSLVVMAGLAVDSGRLVAARTEAADHAENAARLAAQEITLIRLGVRTIDPTRAHSVAAAYFDQHGVDGSVVIDHQSVTVTVRAEQSTTLLHLVGVDSRSLSATRTAMVVAG